LLKLDRNYLPSLGVHHLRNKQPFHLPSWEKSCVCTCV
jgi:hypothetical protein